MDLLGALTAFSATLLGALSANLFAIERTRKEALVDEILASEVAAGLAIALTDQVLKNKQRAASRLLGRYRIQQAQWAALLNASALGTIPRPPMPEIDLERVHQPIEEVDALRSVVSTRIKRSWKPMAVLANFLDALQQLRVAMEVRNRAIDDILAMNGAAAKFAAYFGQQTSQLNDTAFPDLMFAWERAVDDSIYHGVLLIELLGRHARGLSYSLPALDRPALRGTDFAQDIQVRALLPAPENYRDLDKQFRENPADVVVM